MSCPRSSVHSTGFLITESRERAVSCMDVARRPEALRHVAKPVPHGSISTSPFAFDLPSMLSQSFWSGSGSKGLGHDHGPAEMPMILFEHPPLEEIPPGSCIDAQPFACEELGCDNYTLTLTGHTFRIIGPPLPPQIFSPPSPPLFPGETGSMPGSIDPVRPRRPPTRARPGSRRRSPASIQQSMQQIDEAASLGMRDPEPQDSRGEAFGPPGTRTIVHAHVSCEELRSVR